VRSRFVRPITVAAALALAVVVLLALPVPPAHSTTPSTGYSSSGAPAAPSGRISVAPALAPTTGVAQLGPFPADAPLDVAVGLASSNPAGLVGYIDAASTPGSPIFHQALPASAAAARFGASPAAIAVAKAYFEAEGLSVSANPDGLLLDVRGPSAEIGSAFGTSFDLYRLPTGRIVVSHPTPATLPAIAPWTGAVGLGNVTPITVPAESVGSPSASPAATCATLPAGLSPCQIQRAYDSAPLIANGTNGSTIRIGVVDAYSGNERQSTLASDLSTFASEAGLRVGNVSYLYPVPTNVTLNSSSTNPSGWPLEEALDLEWARASAPGASIDMTFSPDSGAGLYSAIDWLVGHRAVDVLSLSWGEPDLGVYNAFDMPCPSACNASTDGSYATLGPVLELAAAEGISVFAASGDCGSADGTSGVATNFPASDPYVTGVGGTVLNVGGTGTYQSESGWSGNQTGATAPGCLNGGGSGGGYAPFPRPWWQVGLPARPAGRGVPDVSLDAATAVDVVENGGDVGTLGTSVATPIWAGIAAIADQAAGTDLGLLNPALYRIAHGPGYHADLHDITTGNNGYAAGTGWDAVTGLGSPVVGALVPQFVAGGGIPTGLSSLVFASPRFGSAPLTVSFAMQVSGGTGSYPLEGVYFGDGNASSSVAGTTQHTFPIAGVYSVQAYAVDSAGNATVSPPVVVVVGGGGPLQVTLTASNSTPALGQSVNFRANATGGTPPYLFDFTFGDGIYEHNLTARNTTHAYRAVGAYCAEVVAWDSASSPNGGASARAAVAAGGAAPGSCGNPSSPLTVTATPAPPPRDAPASFPPLFTVSGGSAAPGNLTTTQTYASSDAYATACRCAIFPTAGVYSVNESAFDPVNGAARASTNVTVDPALDVVFAASTLAGPAPLTVDFSTSASGGTGANAAQTNWTFGNGGSATGSSVAATYSTPGEYLALGLLADSGDGNASEAFLIDAEPTGSPPPLGIAATIDPASNISSGATVRFFGRLIGPANITANDTLAWDLGDGRSAFGGWANETYFAPTGGLGSNTLDVGVAADGRYFEPALAVPIALRSFFANETGGFVPAVSALALASNATPNVGTVGLLVHANSTSSGPGGSSVDWTFGAGVLPGTGSTSRVLSTAGAYTLAAAASDPFGDGATELTGVIVYPTVSIAGGPNVDSGPVPLLVDFSVSASGGAGPRYSFEWSLNGRNVSNASSVTFQLTAAGPYSVVVVVTDRLHDRSVEEWTIVANGSASILPEEILVGGAVAGAAFAILAVWLDRRSPRSDGLSPSRRPSGPGERPGA
jgi:Pro-kumamolisin, activation domain/PKD domain